MIDHADQLREAFRAHEHLAPDPAAVFARVPELSRAYQRRRRGAAGRRWRRARRRPDRRAGPAPGRCLPGGDAQQRSRAGRRRPPRPVAGTAYLADPDARRPRRAGRRGAPAYVRPRTRPRRRSSTPVTAYDDAVTLAEASGSSTEDIGDGKVKAGERCSPARSSGRSSPTRRSRERPRTRSGPQAFFDAGYDYDDAASSWPSTGSSRTATTPRSRPARRSSPARRSRSSRDPPLHRRIGFEVELMAPPGVSRRTLATDLAARHGGQVPAGVASRQRAVPGPRPGPVPPSDPGLRGDPRRRLPALHAGRRHHPGRRSRPQRARQGRLVPHPQRRGPPAPAARRAQRPRRHPRHGPGRRREDLGPPRRARRRRLPPRRRGRRDASPWPPHRAASANAPARSSPRR